MKVVISKRIGAHKPTGTGKWPITSNHERLLGTLREAARRAAQQQRSVLASFTYPIECDDMLYVFTGARLAGLGECFFWERPVERNALVGVGAATTIETNGITCFTDAASAWRTLLNDAALAYVHPMPSAVRSGPIFFCGFFFYSLSPRSQILTDFSYCFLFFSHIHFNYKS